MFFAKRKKYKKIWKLFLIIAHVLEPKTQLVGFERGGGVCMPLTMNNPYFVLNIVPLKGYFANNI